MISMSSKTDTSLRVDRLFFATKDNIFIPAFSKVNRLRIPEEIPISPYRFPNTLHSLLQKKSPIFFSLRPNDIF